MYPQALTFNQRWLMAKNRVASELFKYTGIKEIQLIEKLTAEAEVSAPAEPEVEAEAETEVKEEPSESQE